MSPTSTRRCALALAGLAVVALPVAAHGALSPAGIIAKLNSERAALGIPAVSQSSARSAACRRHNAYMHQHHSLGHFEQRGLSGYTRSGDHAARNAVLAGPRANWANHNPWRNAPIHLAQVYNPGLRSTGASDHAGYSCLYTNPHTQRTGGDKVWTLPADGGSIVRAQVAFEGPSPPQTTVGIPNGRKTGPYLYVWSAAPLAKIVSGSLQGPNGSVAIKVIDSSRLHGLAYAGNGWLLPVKPLASNTMYTATAVLTPRGGGRRVTHTWSFTTTSGTLTG